MPHFGGVVGKTVRSVQWWCELEEEIKIRRWMIVWLGFRLDHNIRREREPHLEGAGFRSKLTTNGSSQ